MRGQLAGKRLEEEGGLRHRRVVVVTDGSVDDGVDRGTEVDVEVDPEEDGDVTVVEADGALAGGGTAVVVEVRGVAVVVVVRAVVGTGTNAGVAGT